MKKTAFLLSLVLTAFAAPVFAQDTNVVFVNSKRILEQAPQAQAAQQKIEEEFSPRKEEIVAAQKELKSLQERLQRDGAVMSESEKRKLEREMRTKQRDMQRAQEAFSEDLNLRRNDILSKLQQDAHKAIASLADEKGYDLVLEAGVVYASDEVDVTDEVIARLRDQSD